MAWRLAGNVAAVQQNPARARLELAADLVDQACLAGAVGADDDVTLAFADGQAEIVGHHQAAERTGEMVDVKKGHGADPRLRNFCTAPQMPPGTNMTQKTKAAPMMASQ